MTTYRLRVTYLLRQLSFVICVVMGLWGVPMVEAKIVEYQLHVNSSAAPGGNGSSAKPFATLKQANEKLATRTPAQRQLPARVLLHPGVFRLSDSLEIGSAESGAQQAPVVWQAVGHGQVRLTGGIDIPPTILRPVTDPQTLARLPKSTSASLRLFEIRLADLGLHDIPVLAPRGAVAWPELFQNGIPLPLASWPNGVGYAGGFKPTKYSETGRSMSFVADPVRAARWKRAKDSFHASVWFGGHWFNDWSDAFLPVASISSAGMVTIGERFHYGIGKAVNLHVYNLPEEMDQAGEYAIEPRQKRILVLLLSGARPKLSLSWMGHSLLVMKKAAHVRFEGVHFDMGRSCGAKLRATHHVTFSRCSFTNLGQTGIDAEGTHITVQDSFFSQIGARGVSLSGGERTTLTHAKNVVDHCTFEHFSRLKRTYTPAVHLSGVGSTISHCLMRNAPHCAILYSGNEHVIRNNEIHSVLMETGDCGAIYAGRDLASFGTVISGNWIHNLGGIRGRWPCGIYLDDCLSGITVKNNWVDHAELGILVGGGRYNQIVGNLVTNCREGIHLDARGITWMQDRLVILKTSLAKIPANQEPWKSRYPQVRRALTDRPGKPVGTHITGNALVGVAKPWRQMDTADVAVISPNFQERRTSAISDIGTKVSVKGTRIHFVRPLVGVRDPQK